MIRKTLLSHYNLDRHEYKVLEELQERERSSIGLNEWKFYLELLRLIESMDEEIGRLESEREDCDCE